MTAEEYITSICNSEEVNDSGKDMIDSYNKVPMFNKIIDYCVALKNKFNTSDVYDKFVLLTFIHQLCNRITEEHAVELTEQTTKEMKEGESK